MKDKNLLYLILKKIDKAVLLILFNTILVSNTLNYRNGGFGGIGLNMSNKEITHDMINKIRKPKQYEKLKGEYNV